MNKTFVMAIAAVVVGNYVSGWVNKYLPKIG